MEKILKYGALVCAFVVLAAAPVCAKVASKYEVVDIVGTQDIYINTALGINNSGVIYGSAYQRSTSTWGIYRYNTTTGATGFTDQMHIARDINNSGAIVGFYSMRNGEDQYCVWNADGSITDLPHMQVSYYLSGSNTSINDSGVVLGNSNGSILSRTSTFIWTQGTGISAPPLPAGSDVWTVNGFNNNGYYLGTYQKGLNTIISDVPIPLPDIVDGPPYVYSVPEYRDAIWSGDGSYSEILSPAENQTLRCNFLNDQNQVTGTIYSGNNETHVFLWSSADGMLDITPGVGNDFWCDALNNNGQVLLEGCTHIGDTYTGGNYIWDADDGLVSVQNLIDPESGWHLENFRGINDNGWIVSGAYNEITHESRDIVLRPITTPEPGSVVALIAGLVGLAGFASRRKPSK
ncbi:MAG: PEP-CTERM sorting domain-containing protein [Armatimonadota bacterium]